MIGVATLDPSTLALWFNPTYITDVDNAELCDTTFRLALGQQLTEYQSFYSKLDSASRLYSANIASAIWHEKRHFLDLVLTNYGAYRVRQFFMVACNSMPMLNKLEKRIAFPFHVYIDPVRRRLAGVPIPESSIEQLATEIAFRQELFSHEARNIDVNGSKCELGGDAQLEALAYSFQVGANQMWLGSDGAKQWHLGLGDAIENARYRWAELVADAYELLPRRSAEDLEFADFTLLITILYAALMMRSWGQAYSHPQLGSVNVLPPYIRLRMLLDDLKGIAFSAASLSVLDAWELVNKRCKKLFDRTAIEELEADYALEGDWVKKLDAKDHAAIAFGDFHNLRGRFIDVIRETPEQVLDLMQWSDRFLPRLQPLTILANPSGVDGEPPCGMEAVLDQSGSSSNGWWWAALLQQPPSRSSFKESNSWLFVLRYLAPLAKLILSGRRHQLMIGPELLLMEHQLERLGYTIYFDGPFEFPTEQDDTTDFYRLSSRKKFVCDFCRATIPHGGGRLTGPWTIRRNRRLAQACVDGLGGDEIGLQRFWRDWSHWHCCDTCFSNFKSIGLVG
jgi:hypothetical protein